MTPTAVQTWRARTLVDVPLAVFTSKTRGAQATIAIYQVLTSSPVLALVLAVVYVDVAVLPRPARHTVTKVSSNQVPAGVGIDARLALTFVGVDEARLPGPLGRTVALETVHQILAGSSVAAWVWGAVVHIDGAGVSAPARRTLALVALAGLRAAPAVRTRVGQTGMFSPLTVGSRVALRTGALVFVWPCVDARSSIQTWLVSAAVV